MAWVIGVDVGGTFTDFYAFDDASGTVHLHKIPSTPANPADAVLDGISQLCRTKGIRAVDIARLSHGTTVGTNTLIQHRGGKVALVTTEGFRDLIEIGRQIRPRMFDFQADHPIPLVPRERRFEAGERMTADGKALRALDAAGVQGVVDRVAAAGADACAVCLIFAFLNPAHERLIAAALAKALPSLYISISSEVQPEFREYERLSTTVLNAYLQPVMARYLGDIEAGMRTLSPGAAIGINQSSGGLMSVERARRFPIRTALSGPAAGAVGAIHMARLSGIPDVISLDMGGTSADVALIRDYQAGTTFDRRIEGYPARLPSVDINAVGAGGGSIAWFDKDGLIKVGPMSAGAVPGPACYGKGGTSPTVTDANLVLGRLSPRGLLGGGMPMDEKASRAAIEPLAERLGFAVERTAHGIIGIVVANMVRAIRAVSVERGHDPRRFALLPFGGAGPLHATDVARSLGIPKMLVPLAPGILCAQGLIVSDLRESFVRTARTRLAESEAASIGTLVDDLRREAAIWFDAERIPPSERTARIVLDMRYVGQNFELAVPIEDAEALPDTESLKQRFFAEHERSYGFHNPEDPIEIINFRLIAFGRLPRPETRPEPASKRAAPKANHRRPVWFAADRPVETPVFERGRLEPGVALVGPAVIEQLDATTLLFPGDKLTVDPVRNLILEVTI
ncbi:MAG: hydantoinase/oxoprolinase family protein [Proteobacteria bacterium]|nr:hydantoinase/oxoprolinase family protein [Pseudomonadota bacterium]MBI3500063.1 hydantoinase/oxoprolinase family protein [Pseudomonadota bacterium]